MKNTLQLGDSHFGKSVELVVDGDNKYILKPRCGKIEKAFEAFLSEIKQGGFPYVPECEHILEQNDCSFKSEIIKHTPAETEQDVQLYFKRCGSLIFLTYLLCSNDLHCENIVASKNTPVVVDSETLINGMPDKPSAVLKGLTTTVTASHLLPILWQNADGELLQMSGLLSSRPNDRNMLIFNGTPCYIYDHIDEVCEGFKSAYEFTLSNIDNMRLSAEKFKGCYFRILLRPTEVYSRMIDLAAKFPENKRRTVLETLLSAAYKKDIRKDRFEYMHNAFEEEVNSLLNGDIPHFSVNFERHVLFSGENIAAKDFLYLSPKECVCNKLENLSNTDCAAQLKIIKHTLQNARPIEQYKKKIISGESISYSAFKMLENGYISNISSGWIQLDASSDNNVYLQNAGLGLYSGLTGILCAYAALYRKTGQRKYLSSLLSHYEPFSKFADSMTTNIKMNDLSGRLQDGIGGIINALFHIYELTDEKILRTDALKLANLITPSLETQVAGDLLGGAAGFALMLPKLPIEISQPLAKALLSALEKAEPSLTGAAHGAAGLALAASCVQKALNINELDNKIIELISYEEKYFNSEKNNWQDLRYTYKTAFMNGWCSGVGGEAMTRKQILSLTDNETIKNLCKRDIAFSAENLSSDTVLKRDSLCCGNSSRIMAASCIGVQNKKLYDIVEKRVKNDNLNLVHIIDTCDINYGLMQGISGVIYSLMMYGDDLSGGMLL